MRPLPRIRFLLGALTIVSGVEAINPSRLSRLEMDGALTTSEYSGPSPEDCLTTWKKHDELEADESCSDLETAAPGSTDYCENTCRINALRGQAAMAVAGCPPDIFDCWRHENVCESKQVCSSADKKCHNYCDVDSPCMDDGVCVSNECWESLEQAFTAEPQRAWMFEPLEFSLMCAHNSDKSCAEALNPDDSSISWENPDDWCPELAAGGCCASTYKSTMGLRWRPFEMSFFTAACPDAKWEEPSCVFPDDASEMSGVEFCYSCGGWGDASDSTDCATLASKLDPGSYVVKDVCDDGDIQCLVDNICGRGYTGDIASFQIDDVYGVCANCDFDDEDAILWSCWKHARAACKPGAAVTTPGYCATCENGQTDECKEALTTQRNAWCNDQGQITDPNVCEGAEFGIVEESEKECLIQGESDMLDEEFCTHECTVFHMKKRSKLAFAGCAIDTSHCDRPKEGDNLVGLCEDDGVCAFEGDHMCHQPCDHVSRCGRRGEICMEDKLCWTPIAYLMRNWKVTSWIDSALKTVSMCSLGGGEKTCKDLVAELDAIDWTSADDVVNGCSLLKDEFGCCVGTLANMRGDDPRMTALKMVCRDPDMDWDTPACALPDTFVDNVPGLEFCVECGGVKPGDVLDPPLECRNAAKKLFSINLGGPCEAGRDCGVCDDISSDDCKQAIHNWVPMCGVHSGSRGGSSSDVTDRPSVDVYGVCANCDFDDDGANFGTCWKHVKGPCMGYADYPPDYCATCENGQTADCKEALTTQRNAWCNDQGQITDPEVCEGAAFGIVEKSEKDCLQDIQDEEWCTHRCTSVHMKEMSIIALSGCAIGVFHCDRPDGLGGCGDGEECATQGDHACHQKCDQDKDCSGVEFCGEDKLCWSPTAYSMRHEKFTGWFDKLLKVSSMCSQNVKEETCMDLVAELDAIDWTSDDDVATFCARLKDEFGCCVGTLVDMRGDDPRMTALKMVCPDVEWDTPACALPDTGMDSVPGLEFCVECGGVKPGDVLDPPLVCRNAAKKLFLKADGGPCEAGRDCGVCDDISSDDCKQAIYDWVPMCGGGPKAWGGPSPGYCGSLRDKFLSMSPDQSCGSPDYCGNTCRINALRGQAEMAVAGCPPDIFDCGKYGNVCGGNLVCDKWCHKMCNADMPCTSGGVCVNGLCWDSVEQAFTAEPQRAWMSEPLAFSLMCAHNVDKSCAESLFSDAASTWGDAKSSAEALNPDSSSSISWDDPWEWCPEIMDSGCCVSAIKSTMGMSLRSPSEMSSFISECPDAGWGEQRCDIPERASEMSGVKFCYSCGGWGDASDSTDCATLASGLDQESYVVKYVCEEEDIQCLVDNICGRGDPGGGSRFEIDDMYEVCANCDFDDDDANFWSCWFHARVACRPGATEIPPDYCATCENGQTADCEEALTTQRNAWCNDQGQITDPDMCGRALLANLDNSEIACMWKDIPDEELCTDVCARVQMTAFSSLELAGCAIDVFDCDRDDGLLGCEYYERCATQGDHQCHKRCDRDTVCRAGEICMEDELCWSPMAYWEKNVETTSWMDFPRKHVASMCAQNEDRTTCMDLVAELVAIDWTSENDVATFCERLKDEFGCCVGTLADVRGDNPDICPDVDWNTPACVYDRPSTQTCRALKESYELEDDESCSDLETAAPGSPDYCGNTCRINALRGQAEMAVAGCPPDIFDCGKYGNVCEDNQICSSEDNKCHYNCNWDQPCPGGGVCIVFMCWDSVEHALTAEPQRAWMSEPLEFSLMCAHNDDKSCAEFFSDPSISWENPDEWCPELAAGGCCASTYKSTMGLRWRPFEMSFFTAACPDAEWEEPSCVFPDDASEMSGVEFCYSCGGWGDASDSTDCATLASKLDPGSYVVKDICGEGDIQCLVDNICGRGDAGGVGSFEIDYGYKLCANCDFDDDDANFGSCWFYAVAACTRGATEIPPDYCAACEDGQTDECKEALTTQRNAWCNDQGQVTDPEMCGKASLANLDNSEIGCVWKDIPDEEWCTDVCARVQMTAFGSLELAGCANDVLDCDRPDGLMACDDDEGCASQRDHRCHQSCDQDTDCSGGAICMEDKLCWSPMAYWVENVETTSWMDFPRRHSSMCAQNEDRTTCMDLVAELVAIDWTSENDVATFCERLSTDEFGCCVGTLADVRGDNPDICPDVDWDTPACVYDRPSTQTCRALKESYELEDDESCSDLETAAPGSPDYCGNTCRINALRGQAEMAVAGCPPDIFDCGKYGNVCEGNQICSSEDNKCHNPCDIYMTCRDDGVCVKNECWESEQHALTAEPQRAWMSEPLEFSLMCAHNDDKSCAEALNPDYPSISWENPDERCPELAAGGCCASTYKSTMGLRWRPFEFSFFTATCPNAEWEEPSCDFPERASEMSGLEFCYSCGGGGDASDSADCATLASKLDPGSYVVKDICGEGDIQCLVDNICGFVNNDGSDDGSGGGTDGGSRFEIDDMYGVCANCDFDDDGAILWSCWKHARAACKPGAAVTPPDYCAACEDGQTADCEEALTTQRNAWCNGQGQITDPEVCGGVLLANFDNTELACTWKDIPDEEWCTDVCAPVQLAALSALALAGCAIDTFDCDRADRLLGCDAREECATQGDHACHQKCDQDSVCSGAGEICMEDELCWSPREYWVRHVEITGGLEFLQRLSFMCALNKGQTTCMDLVAELVAIDWTNVANFCARLKDDFGCCVGTLVEVRGDDPDMTTFRNACPDVDWDTPACDFPDTFVDSVPGLEFCVECGGVTPGDVLDPPLVCRNAAKELFSKADGGPCMAGPNCGVCDDISSDDCKQAIYDGVPMCGRQFGTGPGESSDGGGGGDTESPDDSADDSEEGWVELCGCRGGDQNKCSTIYMGLCMSKDPDIKADFKDLCEECFLNVDLTTKCVEMGRDKLDQSHGVCEALYSWKVLTLPEDMVCSKGCGGGEITLDVACVAHDGGAVVDDNFCWEFSKPKTVHKCNERPCKSYKVVPGDWSKCSASCGHSYKTRRVDCVDEVTGYIVAPDKCGDGFGDIPIKWDCEVRACIGYHLHYSAWSKCSEICVQEGGEVGEQTRDVECRLITGGEEVETTVEVEEKCTTTGGLVVEDLKKSCNPNPCDKYYWEVGKPDECSAECGGGFATRTVECMKKAYQASPVGDNDQACLDALGYKPKEEIKCNTQKCRVAFCEENDCSGRGTCLGGKCKCFDGSQGDFCSISDQCRTGLYPKNNECCETGALSFDGSCCPEGQPLDRNSECCEGKLDACDICMGTAKQVDILGVCCPGVTDAEGLCCEGGDVDGCGICGGDGSTCRKVGKVTLDSKGESLDDAQFVEKVKKGLADMIDVEEDVIKITEVDGEEVVEVVNRRRLVEKGVEVGFELKEGAETRQGESLTLDMVKDALEKGVEDGDGGTITVLSVESLEVKGVCGNGVCEVGEQCEDGEESDNCCPSDCVEGVTECPWDNGQACSGHGTCVSVGGVCNCHLGYAGEKCAECDPDVGYKIQDGVCARGVTTMEDGDSASEKDGDDKTDNSDEILGFKSTEVTMVGAAAGAVVLVIVGVFKMGSRSGRKRLLKERRERTRRLMSPSRQMSNRPKRPRRLMSPSRQMSNRPMLGNGSMASNDMEGYVENPMMMSERELNLYRA